MQSIHSAQENWNHVEGLLGQLSNLNLISIKQ